MGELYFRLKELMGEPYQKATQLTSDTYHP